MARAAAAVNRASFAMEETESNFALVGELRQTPLRPVKEPVGRQIAAVFVGVRITKHDLLDVIARRQVTTVTRVVPQLTHDARGALKILNRFE